MWDQLTRCNRYLCHGAVNNFFKGCGVAAYRRGVAFQAVPTAAG